MIWIKGAPKLNERCREGKGRKGETGTETWDRPREDPCGEGGRDEVMLPRNQGTPKTCRDKKRQRILP